MAARRGLGECFEVAKGRRAARRRNGDTAKWCGDVWPSEWLNVETERFGWLKLGVESGGRRGLVSW